MNKIVNFKTRELFRWMINIRPFSQKRIDRYFAFISFYNMCKYNNIDLEKNPLVDYLKKYNIPIVGNRTSKNRIKLFKDIKYKGVQAPVNIFNKSMLHKTENASVEGTNRLIISYILDKAIIPGTIDLSILYKAEELGLIYE